MFSFSDKCVALAKTEPTSNMDKGRLKWIEVNAMAATIHHVFDLIPKTLESWGLEDVAENAELVYPSWVSTAVINTTGGELLV